MEIQGIIKLIEPTEQPTASLSKRNLIITTVEQYSQTILLEFINDKCQILDNFKQGEAVKIQYNIKGREWVDNTGKTLYFISLQGWKIDSYS